MGSEDTWFKKNLKPGAIYTMGGWTVGHECCYVRT